MVDSLSFDDFLNLPKSVLQTAQEHDEYASLLSDSFIHECYQRNMKTEISAYVQRFKDAKYMYSYQGVCFSNYRYDSVSHQNTACISDPVGRYVTRFIDNSLWVEKFYQCICRVSYKLTMQEAIYFVDTFFAEHSEEMISEKLGICRVTLQKIKKSCIVKIWLELESLKLKECG